MDNDDSNQIRPSKKGHKRSPAISGPLDNFSLTLPLRPRQLESQNYPQTSEAAGPLGASMPRPSTQSCVGDSEQERAGGVLEPVDDSRSEDCSSQPSVKDKGKQRAMEDSISLDTSSTPGPSLLPTKGCENHGRPTEFSASFDDLSIAGTLSCTSGENQIQSNGRKQRKRVRFAELERTSEEDCGSMVAFFPHAIADPPDYRDFSGIELGLLLRPDRGQFHAPALLPSLWELPKQELEDKCCTRNCLRFILFWGSVFVVFVLAICLMTAWSMATA